MVDMFSEEINAKTVVDNLLCVYLCEDLSPL